MAFNEENIIRIVSPFVLFFLGIAYKVFELKFIRRREIQENEDFIANWIINIKNFAHFSS